MDRIPLGSLVRDKVTGLVGVAENRARFLYGVDRYLVQPPVTETGKVPENVMVDVCQLVVLDEKPVMTAAPEPPQLIPLGSKVEDPIRGEKGTATGRAVYLNGCSRILVEPKKQRGHDPKAWWADEPQLILKKEPAKPQTVRPTTGGPARANSKY